MAYNLKRELLAYAFKSNEMLPVGCTTVERPDLGDWSTLFDGESELFEAVTMVYLSTFWESEQNENSS